MWQSEKCRALNIVAKRRIENCIIKLHLNVLFPEYIDGAACYIDVGFSYPSCAEAAKGAGVHRLKGIMSWVQNAVRQFV